MDKNRTVIQSEEVIKNIIDRIENHSENIFLFDATDESYIALDKFILQKIKDYLELL